MLVKVIQRASYGNVLAHFLLQLFHPLLRCFGPVRAFTRLLHLDVQLAPSVERGKDVSGPSAFMLYISIPLMLIKNSSRKSHWEGPAMFITIHTMHCGVEAVFYS